MLLPNTTIGSDSDFSWETFDWDVLGNNHFDDMIAKYIGDEPSDFVVKKITVSKFGDLKITFTNGFTLELFAEGSDDSINWRFFDGTNSKYYFIITGNEIERSKDSE